jgi:hypothetical protein
MAAKKSSSKPVKKWAQKVDVKEGTLHKKLGIPESKPVGKTLINKIVNTPIGETITTPGGKKVKIDRTTKAKATFAKNLNKY